MGQRSESPAWATGSTGRGTASETLEQLQAGFVEAALDSAVEAEKAVQAWAVVVAAGAVAVVVEGAAGAPVGMGARTSMPRMSVLPRAPSPPTLTTPACGHCVWLS